MRGLVVTMQNGRDMRNLRNPLNNADYQNNIVNAERRGKRQVMIRPSSKVVVKVLSVMQKHGKLPCPTLNLPYHHHPENNCLYSRFSPSVGFKSPAEKNYTLLD